MKAETTRRHFWSCWPRLRQSGLIRGLACKFDMKKFGMIAAAAILALAGRADAWFDVRDFGAKGDGVTKDTAAVQRAINACVAAGGGRVVVTNGTFLIAPIKLGSGVELHLSEGATLLGSPDLADYPNRADVRHVDTEALPRKRNVALIFAEESRDVSITGRGRIDANGASFVRPKTGNGWDGWPFERNVDLLKSMPRVVFLTGCRNVRVTDVTLANPPAGWSFWIHDCDDVLFDRVRVRADVRYPNNDGIHVNSCRDVVVRNCDLETGDDSIVVRANNRSLRENKICERVVVSNCVCRSWSAGIRIAWSNDGTIRNCSFRDIRMRDTSVGIALALPGIPEWNKYDYGREATLVEDLVFENIEMDGIYGRPVLMWMSPRPDSHVDAVRRISFRNVRSTGLEEPLFMGLEEKPFEDISFTNCEFRVVGDDVLPGYRRHGAAAWDRYVGSRSRHCKVSGWRP